MTILSVPIQFITGDSSCLVCFHNFHKVHVVIPVFRRYTFKLPKRLAWLFSPYSSQSINVSTLLSSLRPSHTRLGVTILGQVHTQNSTLHTQISEPQKPKC